ncbi:MAG: glycosyltransferase family 2 protein, partial [Alphaproteobacteria bacterium]
MKNKPPLISVIMPAYNVEKYIGKAIKSILTQTHKNLELIIINDASSDKTAHIAKQYSQRDKRIILIDAKQKLYPAKARNLGLDNAKGEFIAWQDADDIS